MTGRCFKAKRILVVGVVPSFAFQRAKYFVTELHRSMPRRFPPPEIHGFFEVEWYQILERWRRLYGSQFWRLRRPVAVFIDDTFVGSDLDLMKIASLKNIFTEFMPSRNVTLMKRKFREDYLAHLKKSKWVYCYLDICVDDNYIGTLVFQLFSQILPRTCANFITLCLGTKGSLLSYKGSRIHRIVKNGWLQGGDIQYKTGGGGFSIYCDPLEDECYGVSHDRRGVLSMANDGKHSNGSQFFVTLKPSTWMDTYYVAFGHLIEGINVLNVLENIETFYDKPLKKIEIKNCGKLDLRHTKDVEAKGEKIWTDAKVESKSKKIEATADQLIRLIIDEIIRKLALKERISDVVHEEDMPSVMNLELYFQGMYSLPEEILEECAKYMRTLKRENLRYLRPSATEIVEVITHDLLLAVTTKIMNLDHVREAVGHAMYQKLLEGIDMTLEMSEKSHISQFVDQLVKTSEAIVDFVSRKLNAMRRSRKKTRHFQDQMDAWVQSFALQETFADDCFRITNNPLDNRHPIFMKKELRYMITCGKEEEGLCSRKKQEYPPCKPETTEENRNGKEQTVDQICSNIGDKSDENVLKMSDFFSTCRYDLKKPKKYRGERIPILDLIEISRFQLKFLRHQENRLRTKERICLEKRINKWMEDVNYTPDTEWVRLMVFSKEDICIKHTEDIMYGALTVALLEMYFLLEENLKIPKRKFYTRVIYPKSSSSEEEPVLPESMDRFPVPVVQPVEKKHRPCLCGDICCDCTSAPDLKEESSGGTTPNPSLEKSDLEVPEEFEFEPEKEESLEETTSLISAKKSTLEDQLMKMLGTEKIDISSFKWMQDYILEKGCLFKTEFVTQVHKWLEEGIFDYHGFLSKHSLVTRASLLSFSMSLASLFKEENDLNSELKDFIFDLWELFFTELFKEAQLEYPPELEETINKANTEEEEKSKSIEFFSGITTEDSDKFSRETRMVDVEEKESKHPNDLQQIDAAEEEVASGQKSEGDSIAINETKLLGEYEAEEIEKPEKPKPAGVRGKAKKKAAKPKRRKSPIFIREKVESEREVREMPPYILPFWIRFITEVTKRALGQLSKMSRFPRRLYFGSDSVISFEDKMQEWIEFNKFAPPTTGRRDIRDYIASHHVSTGDLHDTARSFFKKKVMFELLEKSSRSNSAEILTEELILDLLTGVMKKLEISGSRENIESGQDLCGDLVASTVKCSVEIAEDYHKEKGQITHLGESEFFDDTI